MTLWLYRAGEFLFVSHIYRVDVDVCISSGHVTALVVAANEKLHKQLFAQILTEKNKQQNIKAIIGVH